MLCAAFLVGVAVRSWVDIDAFRVYVGTLVSLVLVFWFWKNITVRSGFLVFFVLCSGILRYSISLPQNSSDFIGHYVRQKVTLIGTVIAEPDTRLNNVKLTLGHLRLSGGTALSGKLLATVKLYPEYHYGDVLKFSCALKPPEPFEDFAYDRYLARSDIYALCYQPTVTVAGQGNGNWLLSSIYVFKSRVQQVMNRGLPEPQASLLSSIVLGSRRGLPETLVADFNTTGLTHLVAISGAQITLVVNLLGLLLPYLGIGRRKAFYLVSGALVVYLVLIGAPASAVRAGVMGWLLLFAYHVGRITQAWRLLLYAAVVMILFNPKILRDDVGFQLSLAAVAGLVYLQPLFEKLLRKVPEAFGLRAALAMTLAAQVATLPLISAQFGRVSLVSPISNLLVFPVSAFVMVAGILAIPLAWFLPLGIAWLPFLPAYFPLAYLIAVAEHLAVWPLAQLKAVLPGLLLIPSYVALAWATQKFQRWVEGRERYVVKNS